MLAMTALVDISAELSARVEELDLPSVPFVYNPLVYARVPHEAYLERWGVKTPREVLLVGMNPGPFGMSIPHPSPANPAASRGWPDAVDARLRALGFEPRG